MNKRTIIIASAIALVLILALAAVLTIPKITARTISIFKIDGNNVQMTKGDEKEFAAKAGMSLFSGYTVSTDIDSYAYLHLDSESLIKMDKISKVMVNQQTSKKLSVAILSGALAIDAATQANGQIIEIRANNAGLVIRGTYIVVLSEENKATFAVLEGSGEVDGYEVPFGSVMIAAKNEQNEQTYNIVPLMDIIDENSSPFLLQAIIDNAETLLDGGILTEDDMAEVERLLNGAAKAQQENNNDSENNFVAEENAADIGGADAEQAGDFIIVDGVLTGYRGAGGEITIPDNVKSIGKDVFSGSATITSVIIPDGVTSIGECAFDGCINLTRITVPANLKSIGAAAFNGTSLAEFVIPPGVTAIENDTFAGSTLLTNITIPPTVTSIGFSAFNGCTSLTELIIPEGVKTISAHAFAGCTSLTSVTIPNTVTRIENDTFNGCGNLTNVTIPSNVTYIHPDAFAGCWRLSIDLP